MQILHNVADARKIESSPTVVPSTRSISSSSLPDTIRSGDLPISAPDKDRLNEDTANFSKLIAKIITDNNIDVPPEILLKPSSDGSISVVGDHPEGEKISALLNDNQEAVRAFGKIGAESGLLRAIDSASDFAQEFSALAGSPSAQSNLVAREVIRNKAEFSLIFDGKDSYRRFDTLRVTV